MSGLTDETEVELECAVCIQPSNHPVRLPCNHIFCFLCVKGVTIRSQKCPMCRQAIPQSYLEHPDLVNDPNDQCSKQQCQTKDRLSNEEASTSTSADLTSDPQDDDEENCKWFYQGRNGWWEYDERTAQDLESHHKKGDKSCELLIAGFLYSIDLENMLQCRRNEPHRRRQIKRDKATNVTDKKGIAGIRKEQVEDVSDQMASMHVGQASQTLRNLVDLGAASSGANISINADENLDDDEDSDINVV